ncbi:hypothetical protein DRE_02896 [Drechslerella stenobrocha 248]|uniref:GST C-terminal domain-containing protein n=1 Tax=Drechslerella stenobrocha 248 TaxID=1043628 RepID=W7HU44_9PEZI|nr:hypothetical protein DRE_02896 [Drechslerella stenobrocha 248]
MQNNFWPHSSRPGIPTLYSLTSSASIKTLWALEELVAAGKLETYHVKIYKRHWGTAPAELTEGFRLGNSPILTVSPASALDEPATVFVESRLINQFLAEHYSDGIWEQPTKEDTARDTYFQEFAGSTFQSRTGLTVSLDIIPQPIPWPFKLIFMAIFYPLARIHKKNLVRIFELMEDSLSDDKPWFAGPTLGLADFCMIFAMDTSVQRKYFDPKLYPKVAKWHKSILELPTYKAAITKTVSYNLKTMDM